MKNELFIENRSKVVIFVIATIILLLAFFCTFGLRKIITANNDRAVEAVLSTLTYTESAADSELAQLEELVEKDHLSDRARGELYQAMTEISYMAGDDMDYNRYIAYALYYLNEVGDVDSYVYLLNKYVGRLYANGCYEAAAQMLVDMATITDIGSLLLETQVAYYLSFADVSQMLGEDPVESLVSASALIARMPEGGTRNLNQAKHDLISARGCINAGDFAQAASILSSYSEDDDFGLGDAQVYVVCDFQIPYFELTAKLALAQQDYSRAYAYVDRYIAACDYYDFRVMKLHLLHYTVDATDDANPQPAGTERYQILEHEVAQENLAEMTDAYGRFLLADVDNTIGNLADSAQHEKRFARDFMIGVAVAYLLIVLYCLSSVILDYISKDGLTRLNNRREFERAKSACMRKHIPHCLLMVDIDDFKVINDTFGHERGDEVLRAVASIMQRYTGRGIATYRYGGEELCMLLRHVSERRAREIAEEVRSSVEHTAGGTDLRVTVSGGIGVSTDGSSALQEADQRLYAAKAAGKNQICM